MKTKLTFFFFSLIFSLCASAQTYAGSSISGKLLDSSNRAVAYTEIEFVSLDERADRRILAITNSFGKFVFSEIPPGKYTLSINFNEKPTEMSPYSTIFYPTTSDRTGAKIFEIEEGTKITAVNFKLTPKLVERRIVGQVVWENGDPVSDAFIYINDAEYDDTFGLTDLRTDESGNFVLKAFENRNYQVGAVLFEKSGKTLLDAVGPIMASARSEVFLLNNKTEKVMLVLKTPAGEEKPVNKNVGKADLNRKTYGRIAKK